MAAEKPKGKKKSTGVIIGLVVAGVAGYYLYSKYKSGSASSSATPAAATAGTSGYSDPNWGGGGGGGSLPTPATSTPNTTPVSDPTTGVVTGTNTGTGTDYSGTGVTGGANVSQSSAASPTYAFTAPTTPGGLTTVTSQPSGYTVAEHPAGARHRQAE